MSKVLFNIAYTAAQPPAKLQGEDRLKYLDRRKFYDMTAEYNALAYMADSRKTERNKDSLSYFTRGKNTGLFNADGALSEAQVAELKKRLASSGSNIWHGFISFNEETSKGFRTQEQAVKFMRQSFNSFLVSAFGAGAKNIELFAALHTDKPHHHHIHFSFFEREPQRLNKYGKVCYTQRGSVRAEVIANYLVSANMHLSERAAEYYTARDRAIDKLKEIKAAAVILYGEKELQAKLQSLSRKLPATGRLQYNSPNMAPYREEIDRLANILIASNPEAAKLHLEMQRQLAKKDREVAELVRDNKLAYIDNRRLSADEIEEIIAKGKSKWITEKYADLSKIDYVEKLRQDYKARVGNQVIGLVMSMRREYRHMRHAAVNDKQLKIDARRRQRWAGQALRYFCRALSDYQRGVRTDFSRSLQDIEREIEMQNEGAVNG